MKRLLSLIIVLILSVSLFAACSGSDTDGVTNTPSDEGIITDGAFSTADVKYLDGNGESVYRIVRPENDDMGATPNASLIFKQMKETLGVAVKNVQDSENGTDAFEILVGHTNRLESQQALDYLKANVGGRYRDYIICTIGKKIVINAFFDEALTEACDYFIKNYLNKDGIKGGIKYTVATKGEFSTVTVNGTSVEKFSVIRPHFNSSYITQLQMEKLVAELTDKTGYRLVIKEDEYVTEGDFEIIVGNTNRSGIEKIDNRDTYSVKISGNKVYLNGGSPYATALAVSEFAKMLRTGAVTDADSATGSYATVSAGYDSATYYKPMWTDDFDYAEIGINGVDHSKWWIISEDKDKFYSEGHNGKTCIRSSAADVLRVEKGCLKMSAKYDESYYYGAMLRSPYSLVFRYGYVEESAILPNGGGLWTALWATSAGGDYCGQEIDINECFGNSKTVAANAHTWPSDEAVASMGWQHTSLDGDFSNEKKYDCPDGKSFSDGFHTFGYLWIKNEMSFTCDGKIYFTYELKEENAQDITAFTTECQLILSFANGFASNGSAPEEGAAYWNETNTLTVDYVHLYQIKDGTQVWRNGIESQEYK